MQAGEINVASKFLVRGRAAALRAACTALQQGNRWFARYRIGDALTIAGVPRGGTTWLAELLGSMPGTTTLWEPLRRGVRATPLGFGWRPHIPEDVEWPAAEQLFRDLWTGRCLHPELLPGVTGPQLLRTRRWLLKFCRLNRLLPWLTNRLPIRPPILLVRHPCAVVASQLRFGAWDHVPSRYRIPQTPYHEVYERWHDILHSLSTREEVLAATWCLDHWFPLTHPRHDRSWIGCSYEALALNPTEELQRLSRRLDLRFPREVYERTDRPSRTVRPGSPILRGQRREQLSGWRRTLSSQQIDRVLRTVDRFGLSDVYTDALEPNYERISSSAP
ncbi:MAG: hypothetical protein ACOC9O_02230 [Myxococcota bacterium]